jgi:hypothetical protein
MFLFVDQQMERELYNSYKRQLIGLLGTGQTRNNTLNALGYVLFGQRWGGVHGHDVVHPRPQKFYLINTSSSSQKGTHWLAMVTTRKHAFIYDSFSRSANRLIPQLIHRLPASGFTPKFDYHRQEQYGDSNLCGQIALAWLLVVRDLGLTKARMI